MRCRGPWARGRCNFLAAGCDPRLNGQPLRGMVCLLQGMGCELVSCQQLTAGSCLQPRAERTGGHFPYRMLVHHAGARPTHDTVPYYFTSRTAHPYLPPKPNDTLW